MGSLLSKSKKNRKSAPSGLQAPQSPQQQQQQQQQKRGWRTRPASEAFVAQNPPHWSHQPKTTLRSAVQGEDSVHYSPMNNYDHTDLYQGQGGTKTTNNTNTNNKKSPRNSGNNNTPPHGGNMAQPRTSTSNGRPSFSLLRGRKSTPIQQEEDHQPILHISAPIIEPMITTASRNYSRDATFNTISTEQPPLSSAYSPRPSLDANRYQQQSNGYVEPPRAPNAGAYKAPVPALPPSVTAQIASLPPSSKTSTPSPPTLDTAAFPSPPNSSYQTSSQEPQRLWRESLRNAAAVEDRKVDSGLVRSNSNVSNASHASHASQSSSTYSPRSYKKNQPISGSTFATTASTLSPSSSNASQTSFGLSRQRSLRTNAIHPESPQSRPRHFIQQDRIDNASMISLPGSRFLGRGDGGASGEDTDDNTSVKSSMIGSPRAQHFQQFPFPPSSPSLTGVNTQNNRYGSQFSSPRLSTASVTSPQRWSQTGAVLGLQEHQQQHQDGLTSPISPSRRSRTASSSARASVASISTANYQWMDEQQYENSEAQDVMHRDSVLMLFNNNNNNNNNNNFSSPPSTSDFSSTPSPTKRHLLASFNTPSPEQMAQQCLEQQTLQHALLKYFFKGNYRAPINKEDLGAVLDVGCGSGLWMKDMALEFPLTEIHGIDLVVPTRRRRPRVAAPLHLSSSTERKMDPHTSIQSVGSSSYRSSNPTLGSSPGGSATAAAAASAGIAPAMLDSMPSSCFFHKGDITQGLPFANNTFDYCHVRLVLWGYPLNAFPELLTELVRVTKKGGWIEFVDMDPCIKKANETGLRVNEWIKTGLIHSNMDPDLVRTLPRFLKEFCEATVQATAPRDLVLNPANKKESIILPSAPSGLDHLKVSKISLPFGTWGGQVGELWQQNFTAFLRELEPMMLDATLSGLVMDQYHRQCQQELQQLVEASQQQSPRMSFEGSLDGQQPAKLTSFDQRSCTHKAWHQLIQQLVRDATLSSSDSVHDTSFSPTSAVLRGIGSSPLQNSSSLNSTSSSSPSIKDMRSYNNIYIVCAQKVDLEEMKQQQLFKHLEDEVLSPNPNHHHTSATFGPMMEGAMSMQQVFVQVEQLQSSKDNDTKRSSTESAAQEEQVPSEKDDDEEHKVTKVVAPVDEETLDSTVHAQSFTTIIEQDDESELQAPQYIELEAESSDEDDNHGEQDDAENTIEILNRVSLEDVRPISVVSLPDKSQEQAEKVAEVVEEEGSLQMLNVSEEGDEGNEEHDFEHDDKEEVLVMMAPESPMSTVTTEKAQPLEQVLTTPVDVDASHVVHSVAPVEEEEAAEEIPVAVQPEEVVSSGIPKEEEEKEDDEEEEKEDEEDEEEEKEDEEEEEEEEEEKPITIASATEVDHKEQSSESAEVTDEEDQDESEEQETEPNLPTTATAEGGDVKPNNDNGGVGSLVEFLRQKTLKKKSKSKMRRSKFL